MLPPGYPELLDDLKRAVGEARWRAQRVVNTELLALYWRIGHTILDRQDAEGWGTRVIDRLSTDLRAAYPEMRGLSRSNLFYMRSFAASWPLEPIVPTVIPAGHLYVQGSSADSFDSRYRSSGLVSAADVVARVRPLL